MKIVPFVTTLLFTIFVLGSCAKKMSFVTSPVVPAATGKVKYKKDDNNNYTITINTENLTEAKNLTPSRKLYVVWMESDGNLQKKLGQINTSSGLFSSKLKGSLSAISTTRPKRVFITAEDEADVQYPGYQTVLITE